MKNSFHRWAVRVGLTRIVLMFIFALTASIPVSADEQLKQYLNLTAPRTSSSAPIVWEQQGRLHLAGAYHRNGRRDVAVLRQDAEGRWTPWGENGGEISGVKGNFLFDVKIGDDGTPWVLVYYTRPSNASRADRLFLYTLSEGRWRIAGPRNGLELLDGGPRLIMWKGKTPVLFYRSQRKRRRTEIHLLRLANDQWRRCAVSEAVRWDALVVGSEGRIYVTTQEPIGWTIREVESLDIPKLSKPRRVFKLDVGLRVRRIAMQSPERFAVSLRQHGTEQDHIQVFRSADEASLKLPMPDGRMLEALHWSADTLWVLTADLEQVVVYRYEPEKGWVCEASAKEPSGRILDAPRLYVTQDRRPIATWDAFWIQ